jgi:hypothetical protein
VPHLYCYRTYSDPTKRVLVLLSLGPGGVTRYFARICMFSGPERRALMLLKKNSKSRAGWADYLEYSIGQRFQAY